MTILTNLAGAAAFVLLAAALVFIHRLTDDQWLIVLAIAWILLLVGSRRRLPAQLPTFNRTLIRTTFVIATVFVIISAQLVKIQIVDSDATAQRTAIAPDGETMGNPRLADSQLSVARGEIYDRDGQLIAGTEQQGDQYLRTWPDPATAYVAGYYSPLLYGSAGLEATYNDELTGQAGNDPLARIVNNLLNRPQEGADLQLTLDAGLQQQATDLLGDSNGAVVVMDAQTGAVLVLASNPTYDPNQIFTATTSENEQASAYWDSLNDDPSAPLVTRANLGLFTPGSTFKTITAAIGIELGIISPDDVYEDDGSIDIDGRVLIENNRPDDSRDQWTVREGIAWSLNVVFAQIGLKIGADNLWDMARQFGFGEDVPFDLPVSESQLASSESFVEDNNALADTAFGQGQILVTPLQMCMVTSMYINNGDMMQPYLVDQVVDESGQVTQATEPTVWRSPISADTAAEVESMMINAVGNGTVSRAAVDGYVVGGKTGTAETGDGSAHSWFIGFIGENEPRYAVAVVLEEGSGGLANAVSIGRDILYSTVTDTPPE